MSDRQNIELQTGPGVPESALNQPVNLLEIIDGITFPISKMELIAYAEDRGASEEIMTQLQAIPDDIYDTRADIVRHGSEIEVLENRDDMWGSAESSDLPDDADRRKAEMNGRGQI